MISTFNAMIAKTFIRRGINEGVTFFCDILRDITILSIEGDIYVLNGHGRDHKKMSITFMLKKNVKITKNK